MVTTLRDAAKPFVPGAGVTTPSSGSGGGAAPSIGAGGVGSSAGGAAGASSSVMFKVTAAPFVPSGSPRTPPTNGTSGSSAGTSTATHVVSQSPANNSNNRPNNSKQQYGTPATTATSSLQLTSNAQPFVPAAARAAAAAAAGGAGTPPPGPHPSGHNAPNTNFPIHPNQQTGKTGISATFGSPHANRSAPQPFPDLAASATTPASPSQHHTQTHQHHANITLSPHAAAHHTGGRGRGGGRGGGAAAADHANHHHGMYGANGGHGGGGRGGAGVSRHGAAAAAADTGAGAYGSPAGSGATAKPYASAAGGSTVTGSVMTPGGRGWARAGASAGVGGHAYGAGGGAYHSPHSPWGVSGVGKGGVGHTHGHTGHHSVGMGRSPLSRQWMDEKIRHQLQAAAYMMHAQWQPPANGKDTSGQLTLPERIHGYHTLLPLDTPATNNYQMQGGANPADTTSIALGVRTQVIKGISSADGRAYVLRRVDGKLVLPSADLVTAAHQAVDTWSPLANHPNIVPLRSTFVSAEVEGSSSLYFVYDYMPGCVTLAAAHLCPSPLPGSSGALAVQPPSEQTLGSYLVQLTAVMRAAHSLGLALGPSCLHASKVLVSPTGRLRVNCCGLVDALAGDPTQEREDTQHAHRLDLTALGQLLLSLACAGLVPPGHPGSLELLNGPAGAARAGPDMCRLMALLLASADGGAMGSVRQLMQYPLLADRMLSEVEGGECISDVLFHDLSKESENGRLLRLLIKLGFVVERPQGDVDSTWSETGDRYLLKLFRDFVFFQRVPEGSPGAGGPLLDWGYVIEALNKLDSGVSERIMLLSRDEAAMLIASYADIKRCVEAAYAGLQGRGQGTAGTGAGSSTQHQTGSTPSFKPP